MFFWWALDAVWVDQRVRLPVLLILEGGAITSAAIRRKLIPRVRGHCSCTLLDVWPAKRREWQFISQLGLWEPRETNTNTCNRSSRRASSSTHCNNGCGQAFYRISQNTVLSRDCPNDRCRPCSEQSQRASVVDGIGTVDTTATVTVQCYCLLWRSLERRSGMSADRQSRIIGLFLGRDERHRHSRQLSALQAFKSFIRDYYVLKRPRHRPVFVRSPRFNSSSSSSKRILHHSIIIIIIIARITMSRWSRRWRCWRHGGGRLPESSRRVLLGHRLVSTRFHSVSTTL